MQQAVLFFPRKEVIDKLEIYLRKHYYKNIIINHVSGKITAERKNSFFRKADCLLFTTRETTSGITHLEITYNPQRKTPTKYDLENELKLRGKIYFYF